MEALLDLAMKQHPDHARGDRGDDEQSRVAQARAVAAHQAAADAPEPGAVEHQQGPERATCRDTSTVTSVKCTLVSASTRTRCPELETGRNSVSPCTSPNRIPCHRLT